MLVVLLLLSTLSAHADEKPHWQQLYEQMLSIEDADNELSGESYEMLSYLAENPINLNGITRESLEQLPFLTARQIEDIVAYCYRYGPLRSLGELKLIPSLDEGTRQWLSCFVYAGGETVSDSFPKLSYLAAHARQQFMAAVQIPAYKRQGFKSGYASGIYKNWLRYTWSSSSRLSMGFVASHDAGEPFFQWPARLGYDFYSFYIMLRRWHHVNQLVVGRYRIKAGMGLVLNTNYGFGKLTALSTLGRGGSTITGHTSRSEANYMQGTAASLSLNKQLNLTLFASLRQIDGTLATDSSGAITTIITNGYHRSASELAHRHNATQSAVGGRVEWNRLPFRLGFTACYSTLNRRLEPSASQIYRKYYPRGKQFANAGIDYAYIAPRLTVQGETAMSQGGAIASLNTLSMQLGNSVQALLLQRFYSYRYSSLLAHSYSENGRVQNETGVMAGLNFKPTRHLALQACADYCYSPWPRYGVSVASHTVDGVLQAVYTLKHFHALLHYRCKLSEKDNEEKTRLLNQQNHRLKLKAGCDWRHWYTETTLEGALHHLTRQSDGYVVAQTAGYTSGKLSLTANFDYFNTQDYNSRVYLYERAPLYTLSLPCFYGEGIHYMLLVSCGVGKHLNMSAKVYTTNYFDRNHISSGLQQVNQSSITDIELQARITW